MDKLYSTVYYITIEKAKITNSWALPTMGITVDGMKDPTLIFHKLKEFIPLHKDNKVHCIKWKLLSLVTEELIEEVLIEDRKIYFMDLKGGTLEEMDKKWGTIFTTCFTPLPEQARMLLDFFVWFSLEKVTDLDEHLILQIRFFFITRSKLSIEASIENILEKCYHMWDVQQEANIEEKKLDDFQSVLNRVVIYGNSVPKSEFSISRVTKTELPTKLSVSIKSEEQWWMIAYIKELCSNKQALHNTMKIEDLEMVIDGSGTERKVSIDLDDEDFLRDYVVRVKADTILADNCISFTDFRKKCKEFYQGTEQSGLPLWSQ